MRTGLSNGAGKIPEIGKRRSETGPQNWPKNRFNTPRVRRRDSFRPRKALICLRFPENRRKSLHAGNAWLGREDSNLRRAESKSAALPPISCRRCAVSHQLQKDSRFPGPRLASSHPPVTSAERSSVGLRQLLLVRLNPGFKLFCHDVTQYLNCREPAAQRERSSFRLTRSRRGPRISVPLPGPPHRLRRGPAAGY